MTEEEDLVDAKGRSGVWKYLKTRIVNGVEDRRRAFCKICKQWIVGGASGKGTVPTTNYLSHMRTDHPDEYHFLMGRKSNGSSASLSSTVGQSGFLDTWLRGSGPLPEFKKKAFLGGLVDMISADYQPFTIVEDRGFRSLLAAIDERLLECLPSRKTLRRHIHTAAERKRDSLKEIIRDQVEYYSISVDSWTSKSEDDYTAIELHYVDPEWRLRTICLGTAFTLPNHRATTLSAAISGLLGQYSLTAENLAAFVSDSAHNIQASLRGYNRPAFPCLAHILHLVVKGCMDPDTGVKEVADCVASVRRVVAYFKRSPKGLKELHAVQTTPQSLLMDTATRWNSTYSMMKRFQEHRKALIKWSAEGEEEIASAITAMKWAVVDAVVAVLKPLVGAVEVLQGEKFVTLSLIIPLVSTILAQLKALSGDAIAVERSIEWNTIHAGPCETPNVARVLEELTEKESAERKAATASAVQLSRMMISDMEERLNAILESQSSYVLLASALDPRWKCMSFPKHHIKALMVEGAMWRAERASSARRPITVPSEDVDLTCGDVGSPSKKRATYLEGLAVFRASFTTATDHKVSVGESSKEDVAARCEREAESFLGLPLEQDLSCDPLTWWHQNGDHFPRLSDLARIIFSIPATSASVERLFSSAGYFVSARRCRLKPSLVDDLLVLHSNDS